MSVGTVAGAHAEMEAESSKFLQIRQRSYERLMMVVRTEQWADWY